MDPSVCKMHASLQELSVKEETINHSHIHRHHETNGWGVSAIHIKWHWLGFFPGRALQWFEEILSRATWSTLCHARFLKGFVRRTTATPRDRRKMGRAFEKMGER